jgi:hypothetical protein
MGVKVELLGAEVTFRFRKGGETRQIRVQLVEQPNGVERVDVLHEDGEHLTTIEDEDRRRMVVASLSLIVRNAIEAFAESLT